MKLFKSLAVVAALAAAFAGSAQAQVRITEVAPWSSTAAISPVGVDWFEITNFGSSSVNLAGWKMDDNSFSSGLAVALNGVSTLAAGQSAIFLESAGGAAISAFVTDWFNGTAPVGAQIGYYSGSGVGLSQSVDGVILFDSLNVQQAKVSFGASPTGPYGTFDNSTGLDNVTLSTLSVVGVHGAFQAPGNTIGTVEIGSPLAVPEPETYAMLLAGLALIGGIARRRKAA